MIEATSESVLAYVDKTGEIPAHLTSPDIDAVIAGLVRDGTLVSAWDDGRRHWWNAHYRFVRPTSGDSSAMPDGRKIVLSVG